MRNVISTYLNETFTLDNKENTCKSSIEHKVNLIFKEASNACMNNKQIDKLKFMKKYFNLRYVCISRIRMLNDSKLGGMFATHNKLDEVLKCELHSFKDSHNYNKARKSLKKQYQTYVNILDYAMKLII